MYVSWTQGFECMQDSKLEMRPLHKLRLQITMTLLKKGTRRKLTHCHRGEQGSLHLCLGSGYGRKFPPLRILIISLHLHRFGVQIYTT